MNNSNFPKVTRLKFLENACLLNFFYLPKVLIGKPNKNVSSFKVFHNKQISPDSVRIWLEVF